MWVELTGSPNWEAMMTVSAADRAIQNARVLSSSVISVPTVLIRRGPNSIRPTARPRAPTSITHKGMDAAVTTAPADSASLMAASGPMALATSFAPWAKLSNAAANISGQVNRVFTPAELFSMVAARRPTRTRIRKKMTAASPRPTREAPRKSTSTTFLTPFTIK